MKTIKQRAIDAAKARAYDANEFVQIRQGYIQGATEQSEIDSKTIEELKRERDAYYDRLQELRVEIVKMDKACAWLALNYEKCVSKGFTTAMVIDAFRKAMEE